MSGAALSPSGCGDRLASREQDRSESTERLVLDDTKQVLSWDVDSDGVLTHPSQGSEVRLRQRGGPGETTAVVTRVGALTSQGRGRAGENDEDEDEMLTSQSTL